MIASQRHLFDIPEEVAYLNCAYMSPLPRSVVAAGERAVARKARPWEIHVRDFFTDTARARILFAGLIGADADSIAIVPAVSYGIATAARNVAVAPGQRIVVLAEQFPSNVYAWRALAAGRDATVVTVARPEPGRRWSDAVLEAIDERVAVVATAHCHWTDGSLLDVEAIGRRCREVGAALVLDLTQSAGVLPFDVSVVAPDFVVCACYKWLLGPYSLGFLYAAPRYHRGLALEQGWITRPGSEDFAALVDYRDESRPDASRFDMGERSSFHLMPMAVAALEQITAWRVPAIQATLAARNRTIAARVGALGLTTLPEDARAGHYLGLRFPGGPPDQLTARLAAEGVHVSVRGDSMRVTPHLYNTDADAQRLLDALARMR